MTRFFNVQLLMVLLFCGSLGFTSHPLLAATLSISDDLIVSKIDDESVEHGFLGKKSVFTLEQGSHAIILRYKDVFEDLDFAEDRVVESKEFVVKLIVAGEEELSLTTIEIKNLASAQSFSKSPTLKLSDENNKPLAMKLETVSDYKLAKQVNIAVNTLTPKQTVKASALTSSAELSKSIKTIKPKQPANNTLIPVNSLTMLKYWWKNASKEEKKYFKEYINITN